MGQLGFPGANCDAHVGCLGVRMIGLHVDGFNFISSCSVLDFNQGRLAIAEQWGEAFELQTRRWQGSYSTAQYVSYSIIDVDVPQALLNQMNSQLDNLQRGRGAHAALSRTSKMARSLSCSSSTATWHLSLSAAGLRWCCSAMALTCHLTPLLKSSSCLQALCLQALGELVQVLGMWWCSYAWLLNALAILPVASCWLINGSQSLATQGVECVFKTLQVVM